jgi:hypothetical protein
MATPVLSFNYPGTSRRFFFIYNTFTDSPETIPMDLPMFLSYHCDTGRSMLGFLSCYEDIIQKGCSLLNSHFDSFMTANEQDFLFDLVRATDFIAQADANSDFSAQLNDAIIGGASGFILRLFLEKKSFTNRHHSYFRSIHYTREWEMHAFQRLSQEKHTAVGKCPLCGVIMGEARLDLLFNWSQVIHSADFYKHFMLKHSMPAEYMPHIYRSQDFYIDYCRSSNQGYLLLTLEGNDYSEELPF